jgi:RimJ/RimL family protein N-acetyltransferase
MPTRVPYEIRTPRLVLRCWQPNDAALLKEAIDASLEHLRPWMPWAVFEPEPLNVKVERLRKFRGQFDLDQQYVYGIFNPDETLVLGSSGLHKRLEDSSLEIGYWIHAGWINQGYATETAAALTKAAFQFFRVQRVEIHCDAGNVRSAAVPRKLGYTLDATLRRRTLPGFEGERETMVWSIFPDEFQASSFGELSIHAYNAAGEEIL